MENPIEVYFDELAPSWDKHCAHEKATKLLFARLGIKRGDRVIDIACGTGVVTALLHSFSCAPVVGIDLSKKMIEQAQEKYAKDPYAHFVHGDFLTYSEESVFDYAVIYNAYPHFLDPDALAEALSCHLVKAGRFAIVHSLSRSAINAHHEGMDPLLSRPLLSAEEEARCFASRFVIEVAEDNADSYLIIGRKK